MSARECNRCGGPLEWVDLAHDRSKTAIWCPSCNIMWQPSDQPPRPAPPAPVMNRADIIEIRAIKAYHERQQQLRSDRKTR